MGPHRADANLAALIESTEDLIWSVDLNYRLLAFNRAFHDNIQRNFGIRSAVGMRPEDLLPPARAAVWPSQFERARSEGPFRAEYSLADGRILELSFNRIVQDGETTGISVFGKDITERKTAEAALREAEEKYRGVFEGALHGIYQTSLEGKPLAANSAFAKMLGYESAQEVISTITDPAHQVWLDPNGRSRFRQLLEEHKVVRGYECQFKRKDGTAIWVSLNCRKVCGKDGRTLYDEGFIEDITERKRMEDALRSSEEKYRDIFEGALEGIFRASFEGKPLAANPAFARMLGYHSAREFMSAVTDMARQVWLDPDGRLPYLQLLEQHGVVRGYECQFKRKDGTAIWVSLNSRKVFGEDGQALYYEGFIEDITERKRMQDALRNSEEKYRDIFEGALEGIYRTSLEGKLLAANPAVARMLGYDSAEELISATTNTARQVWLDPNGRSHALQLLEQHQVVRGYECQFKRKDGTAIWVSLSCRNVCGKDGRALYNEGFIEDITERRRMQDALRNSEEKYRDIFEGALEGIYRTSLEGKLLAANPAAARMLGYDSAEELISATTNTAQQVWLDLNGRSRILQILEQHGVVRGYECQYKRKDGTAIWVSLSCRNVCGKDGRALYNEGFIEDITERRRMQDALRKSEEQFAKAFRVSPAVMLLAKVESEGNRIIDANEAFERVTGYRREEVIGRIAKEFGLFADPGEYDEWMKQFRSGGRIRGFEFRFRRKSGDIGTGLISVEPMEIDGEPWMITATIDITKRKKAEARLQAQYERFQRIIENTDAGYFRIGMDGCYEDVNPAWLRMHGFTRREDAIGLHFSVVQVPENAGNAGEIVEELMQGEPVRSGEFSRLRRDGTIGYHSLSANPVLDGDRVIGVEGFMIDITERKAAERDRQRSERQYRSLFNSMQEGVALHKLIRSDGVPANYILLDVNPRFEEIIGMKREHVVNKLATGVYGTEAAPYLKEYASVVEGGRPLQFETYFSPLDKIFVISATPIADDLFATIFFDITEEKRTQAQYRLISENAADVIWMWDLEERRCVYVSPSVQQLRGFSSEEVLAQPMEQAMPGDTYRAIAAETQRRRAAVESGDEGARIQTNEVVYLRKDGTTVATETVTKLLSDARGKARYVLGISRDITELKRAEAEKARIEDQLRQAQKLESVGRLAAGVAHDFNNLLTVINGFSRLLLGGLKVGDPLRDGLEEIHKAGERAAGLTQQLLAFSRKQILQPRVLDLNRVVEEMRPMLERLMGENVEVCVQLHAQPTTIRADPHQLHQVLMNLAANSRDAMPRGGRFSIETTSVEWDESHIQSRPGAQAGPYVMLAVSDTGVGMNVETCGHIFEPFFTTKEVGKGTGLGLSTIHGIVEQSGGSVEVASELGRGTTFKIFMPRVVDAQADSGKPEAVVAIGGKETVLVVEDQAVVRRYAATALRTFGYQVIEAENADEALQVCERERDRIDLILTDVVMPGLSGRELADRLKQLRPEIKVMFMSGYTDDAIVHPGALEKGAEFIQKPFSPDQLAIKVREMLVAAKRPTRAVVADDEAGDGN